MTAMASELGTQPRTVTNVAPGGNQGMTLADLVQFTRDCIAAGVDPASVPRVRSSMSGRILQIAATDGAR
jgi:hypothetical protein